MSVRTSSSVSRRRVVAGAAWAVPTAVVATSAPAFAASTTCETVPLMTSGNGWSTSSVNMSTNGTNGFRGASGYSVIADTANTAVATVTVTSPTRQFTVGRTYVFTFNYSVVGSNPRQLQMAMSVAGQALPGASLNSDTTVPTSGSRSVSYVPTVSSTGSVQLVFTFPAGTSVVGDDITISNFAATCV